MVSLRQLQHVIALADHRHFGRAAEAIGVTQAALTLSIQKIEQDYGVLLFERRHGQVSITCYGEVVLESAQAAVSRVGDMRRELLLMRKLATGRLVVGCDAHFGEALVAPVLAKLLNEYPHLQFTVEYGRWTDMRDRLLNRSIDLFIGFEDEAADQRFSMNLFMLPPLILCCRPGHPVMDSDEVTIAYLYSFPTVITPTSHWIQKRHRPLFVEAGLEKVPASLEATDYSLIRQVVRGSDALSLGLFRVFKADLESGTLARVPFDIGLIPGLMIASSRDRSLPPAAELFVKAAGDEIEMMNREWAQVQRD
jgi:DNA-binding transcriptional LysR family regulator